MDARPQRLRVPKTDENLIPLHSFSGKDLAIQSTINNINGLKAAAKRTALGDVSSNAAKRVGLSSVNTSSRQNLLMSGLDKENGTQLPKDAFSRPAQRLARPLGSTASFANTSIEPLKDIAAPSVQDGTREGGVALGVDSSLQPEVDRTNGGVSLHPSSHGLPGKKPTVVFKDYCIGAQSSSHHNGGLSLGTHAAARLTRQHKSQPQLRAEQPILRRTQSKHFENLSLPLPQPLLPLEDLTEAPYEDAVEHLLKDDQYGQIAPSREVDDDLQAAAAPPPVATTSSCPAPAENEEKSVVPPPAALSEPDEEYWDEEEDEEELYDDQGYITAHSYRSRGDLTTGGMTTVVFPKITSRVLKELEAARLFVEATRTDYDVEEDAWDVSMVAEYSEEIFAYMRELEMKLLPSPDYMVIQSEMQWSMRSILMEWLVQVHDRFGLLPETLFLAVNYIDRFLSVKIISLAKLQLVGATAILVAAKYEEINCPSLDEIIYMVDDTYTTAEIMKAERFMLSMLQFELGWPGPMSFLRRSSKADDYDLDTRTLAKYFLEVTIMDERFVGSPCSFLAAGAHCLSRLILKKGDWSAAHVHYSGYTWSQLRPLLCLMLDCCQIPKKHHAAVYEKYADRRYNHCAQEVLAQIKSGFTIPLYHPNVGRQTASLFGGSNTNMSNCTDLAQFPAVSA